MNKRLRSFAKVEEEVTVDYRGEHESCVCEEVKVNYTFLRASVWY